MKYEDHILALQELEGFCRQFYLYCGEYGTQQRAYEATERMFQQYFGKRKYADFESFRQVRNRMLKSKQKM